MATVFESGLHEDVQMPINSTLQLAQRNATELELAKATRIATREDFEAVSAEMVRLKTLRKEVDDRFNPIIEKAHGVHKEALAQKRIVADPLDQALSVLSPKCAAWLEYEEQQRQAEQRKQLEASRMEAEQVREETIEAAEAAGADAEEVAALCAMPLDVAPIIASRPQVKGQAVVRRESFRALVEGEHNKLALVVFIAKNPRYLNLLAIDQAALNRMASALKSTLNIPGVKVIKEVGTATYTTPRGIR